MDMSLIGCENTLKKFMTSKLREGLIAEQVLCYSTGYKVKALPELFCFTLNHQLLFC